MNKGNVDVVNVSKNLGKKQILDNVSLTVNSGEVIGVVGSNGSGKTTLLRLISGLLYPDQGEIKVNDQLVVPGMLGKLPVSLGVLIETPLFLPYFSGYQNLQMLASIQDKISSADVQDNMRRVGLEPKSKKRVGAYSLGMRQRLGIAQAIMEKPAVLLLDEPTNALDADGVEVFADIISEFVSQGAAIILVSHLKEEIDRFCDRVYKIENNQISTIRQTRERKWQITLENISDLEKIAQILPFMQIGPRINDLPTCICRGGWRTREELITYLIPAKVSILDVEEQPE